MATENKGATIEENLEKLNEIAEKMQDPNVSLEDSFKLYQEGVRRINECNDEIANVKQRIEIMEGDEVRDFDKSDNE